MAKVTLSQAQKIALERESGAAMRAARDAAKQGDEFSRRIWKKRAMALIKKAHPL